VEPHPTLSNMKFSSITSLYALAGLVAPGQAESPTPVTKATVSDKANLGFATQNGGYVPVFLRRVKTGEIEQHD